MSEFQYPGATRTREFLGLSVFQFGEPEEFSGSRLHGKSKRSEPSIANLPPRKQKTASGGATRANQAKGDRDLLGLSIAACKQTLTDVAQGYY